MSDAERRRLIVIGLGGNAISPPRGMLSMSDERDAISDVAAELAEVIDPRTRLLLVHGNGPQVGRLLAAPGIGAAENIDIHVAQTQGEIGYLLAEAMHGQLNVRTVALVTRVLVDAADPAFANPRKPVGPVLAKEPAGVASVPMPDGRGWRRAVASPRPIGVIERDAIAILLQSHHVIAGGGGGVALTDTPTGRQPRMAVIDKDWVAACLATSLGAEALLFVTDVAAAFDRFGDRSARPIDAMTVTGARRRLMDGIFADGSMRPKVESAVAFVEATGRDAIITTVGAIGLGLAGGAGTRITA